VGTRRRNVKPVSVALLPTALSTSGIGEKAFQDCLFSAATSDSIDVPPMRER
jgi:hypothetical protein